MQGIEGEKHIPKGFWVYMNRLPAGTTDEKLRVWLAALGIDIPIENISVRLRRDGDMGAVVNYPQDVAVRLLNWAIGDQKLAGRPVLAEYKPQRIGERW
jgi:DNA phosphorothioation-dependent restriction protein DptG